MLYPYKVIFLESSYQTKAKYGRVDAYSLSKELEALVIEQDGLGYELFSVVPVTGNLGDKFGHPVPVTMGFTVTFKRKKDD